MSEFLRSLLRRTDRLCFRERPRGAQQDVFNAGLLGSGDRYRIAVATHTGRDPKDVKLFYIGRTIC